MEINGKDDYVARWLHGLCAVPLLALILWQLWSVLNLHLYSAWLIGKIGVCGYGLYIVFFKLLRYAFTGEGSINRDILNNIAGDDLEGR